MISNHHLLIDKNCPMCSAYGKCFVHFKLIDPNVISPYQEADDSIFQQVDAERSKSEIALLDKETGNVIYGLSAFLHILFPKRGWIFQFLNLGPIYFLLNKFYRFISYNRHVIAVGNNHSFERNCIPNTHKAYRWTYILLTAIVTGIIVNAFTVQLDAALGVPHQYWREFLVCFGQILWQFGALSILNRSKRLDYLGNMSTVSLIGGLLLIPILLINHFVVFNWMGLLIAFGSVVGIMFYLHIMRCKRLGLPFITTISWVTYRSIVLLIILISIL